MPKIAKWVFYSVLLMVLVNRTARAGETAAATTQDTAGIIASLRQLSQEGSSELSTAPTSASDRFVLTCYGAMKVPSLDLPPYLLTIARDRNWSALLSASFQTHDIYSYLTNGLLLAVDHDNPDSLVRIKGVGPGFLFAPDHGLPAAFEVGAAKTAGDICFRPGAIIEKMIPSITSISFDPNYRLYSIRTRGSIGRVGIFPANAHALLPICELSLATREFSETVVVSPSPSLLPPFTTILRNAQQIDDAINQVAVKVIDVKASGRPDDILRILPPNDFSSGRYDDTSARLRLILLGGSCAPIDNQTAVVSASSRDASAREAYSSLRKRFRNAGRLRLTAGPETSAKDFCASCAVRSGPLCLGGYNLVFVRKGDRTAVRIADPYDHLYSYITDDLAVAVDLKKPGGLVVVRGVGPELLIKRPAQNSDEIASVKLVPRNHSMMAMDITDFIAPTMARIWRILYEPTLAYYLFSGDNGMGMIQFNQNGTDSPVSLRAFEAYRINGRDLWARMAIGKTASGWNDFSITPQAIRAIGLPIRELAPSEASSVPMFPPADSFELNSDYLVASQRLRLLMYTGPATESPVAK